MLFKPFESLESRRRLQLLRILFRIISDGLSVYLCKLIYKKLWQFITRNVNDIPYSISSSSPWAITEWNKTDIKNWNSSYSVLKCYLFKELRPPLNNIQNPSKIKLLARLRMRLSPLNRQKFNHNFDDFINLFGNCSLQSESASYFYLHYHHYDSIWWYHLMIPFDHLNSVDKSFKLFEEVLT